MAVASGGVLDDQVIVVTGADQPVVRGIGVGLAAAGAVVAPVAWDAIESRAAAEAAFADVADGHGRVDGVLHAAIHPIAYERVAMADVDDARWDAVWEQTLRRAIFVLQAGYAHLRGRGGAFVVVTPVLGMAGAAELAPCAAALEGVRVLAKSAARQWGEYGIRVNCLAPAPEHVSAGIGSGALALSPPALGGPGDPTVDLAPIAAWLFGPAARFLTGATLPVDGGVWMAP